MEKLGLDFWRGKTVFVTGHTGFKGSWLCKILYDSGAKVYGYSLPLSYQNKLFTSIMESNVEKSYFGDINDDDCLQSALLESQPEIIFHLAAQPLVMDSYKDPIKTFETNIIGTARLILYSSQLESLKSLVNVTSDKCYANNNSSTAFLETDPMGGKDPYSASKGCAELISASLQSSFVSNTSIGLANVRAGNVIGGGDFSPDRLIPDIVEAIAQGKKVKIRNPLATRPWQHVFEPLNGYMMVAENLFSCGPAANSSWNFGPHLTDIRNVDDIAQTFCKEWGLKNIIEYDKTSQPHEAKSLSLDISKAYSELKWSPQWSLEISLAHIADWYKTYLNNGDIAQLSIEQIDRYFHP